MNPTVSRGQQARAAKPRAALPIPPIDPKKHRGHAVNLNWREDFLAAYEAHGGLYQAAKTAGVNSTTVYDEFARNPAFQLAADEARERYCDTREFNLTRLADEGNVVGDIVYLKAKRPTQYVEKNLSITATFSTQLDPAAGQALLATMLGHLAPTSTAPVLANPQESQRIPGTSDLIQVLPTQAGPAQDGAQEGGKT